MGTQREEKYVRILDGAVEAFAESGYHQCTVSKIAVLAGVATGTIYLYFKSKEEILIRVFQERMGDFIAAIRLKLKDCDSIEARLRTIIHAHLSYMEQNRALAIVTQIELRQSDPKIREAVIEPVLEYFGLIEEVIRLGIADREIPEVNVKVARQMIFGALEQVTTDWVWSESQKSLTNQVEPLLHLMQGALRLGTGEPTELR